jgi:hypothetical protein
MSRIFFSLVREKVGSILLMRQMALFGEFCHELALPFIDRLRYPDVYRDKLIAPLTADGQSFAANPENGTRLCPRRNPHLHFAVDGPHAYAATQGGLNDIDGHLAEDVPTPALEKTMRTDPDGDDQVSGGGTAASGLTLTAEADMVSIADARRDGHRDLPHPLYPSTAAAGMAGTRDDLPAPIATGAWPVYGECALGKRKESLSMTLRTNGDRRTRLCSRSRASRAGFLQGKIEECLPSGDGRLERYLDLRMKVLAPPEAGTWSARCSAQIE